MEAVLRAFLAFNPPAFPDLDPRQARQVPLPGVGVVSVLAERSESIAPEMVGSVGHLLVPGPAPEGILIRTYRPEGEGPFPIIVNYHGGGWVIAGLDGYEASCRALCNAAGATVLSVDYGQAPEHPFPAAMDDAYAALQWAIENAAFLGGDPAQVAVVGESPGGNLATVSCMRARDEGAPLPVHQVLVYPVANFAFDTPSYLEFGSAVPLSLPLMEWFWGHYLPDPSAGSDLYASPLQATDLTGLPPATVIAAQVAPLTSEGQAYADALAAAGIDVECQLFEGVAHEFFGMGAVVEEARQAVSLAAERFSASFGGSLATPVA